jgi:hypothetical protein
MRSTFPAVLLLAAVGAPLAAVPAEMPQAQQAALSLVLSAAVSSGKSRSLEAMATSMALANPSQAADIVGLITASLMLTLSQDSKPGSVAAAQTILAGVVSAVVTAVPSAAPAVTATVAATASSAGTNPAGLALTMTAYTSAVSIVPAQTADLVAAMTGAVPAASVASIMGEIQATLAPAAGGEAGATATAASALATSASNSNNNNNNNSSNNNNNSNSASTNTNGVAATAEIPRSNTASPSS